jgi:lipopolysaccharide biosynthesis glycosyltransferase
MDEARRRTEPVHCVFTFDGPFAKYAAVAIASLLCHAKGPYRITCLVHEAEPAARGLVEGVAETFGAAVAFIEVDHERFRTWKLFGDVSAATYYRLAAPRLLTDARAIYLDSDVLVTCDLGPLFETDLGGAWIGGVVDRAGTKTSRLPLRPGDPYLNAGVLLLDLEALRLADFETRCAEVQRSHADVIQWADQCVINKAAEGHKAVLDPRWNVQANDHGCFGLEGKIGAFDRRGILHPNAPFKPWMTWSDPWLQRLWAGYARLVELPRSALVIEPSTLPQWSLRADVLEAEGRWREAAQIRKKVIAGLTTRTDPATATARSRLRSG